MSTLFAPGVTSIPFETLETQLKHSLRPVKPNQEFVDHLQNRLKSPSTTILEHREGAALGLLLVAFSLASGVLLVFLMRRLRQN
ncbi:MAG TPA: hypothetical protein VF806_01200 [Anaerolineaceae bacterium]